MKSKLFLIGIILTILFTACDSFFQINHEKILNDFDFVLSDDVSPLNVKLSVQGEWNWTRWTLDSIMSNEVDKQSGIVRFHKPGVFPVKFEGYKDGYLYKGSNTINIPKVATKLKIEGFTFPATETNMTFENKNYKVELAYYNSEKYDYQKSSFKISGETLNDSIFFDKPVEFYIAGFNNIEKTDNIYMVFSIYEEEETLVNDMYFHGYFFVNNAYLYNRFVNPGEIMVNNFRGKEGINNVLLIADWMP